MKFVVAALALLLVAAGPDVRAQAAREGRVVWYTTLEQRTLSALVERFGREHPELRLETLRLGTAQLAPRIVTEQRGQRFAADVVSGELFGIGELAAVHALQRYRSPEAGAFLKGTVDPNGYWTSLTQNTTVIAWNTERLRAAGLTPPRTLADLTQPQWRGRIGLDTSSYDWYAATLRVDPAAADVFARLAQNKPLLTASHTQSLTQLEAGEFDATPTTFGYLAERERAAGRPVDFVTPQPALLTLIVAGIAENAPHPNAARLFVDWLLSRDTQQFIATTSGRSSSRLDVRSDPHVWDPRKPYAVIVPPPPEEYRATVAAFDKLFGIAR